MAEGGTRRPPPPLEVARSGVSAAEPASSQRRRTPGARPHPSAASGAGPVDGSRAWPQRTSLTGAKPRVEPFAAATKASVHELVFATNGNGRGVAE